MNSIIQATAILTLIATVIQAQSGSGTTTRYWDCCKPSCAWNNVAGVTKPVTSCDKNDNPLTSTSIQSGCAGGSAYMCSNQSPWAVNDNLAYGFAAVSASSAPSCCSCYQLTFTSGAIAGKKMIVQATNTGYDVGSTQFDIAMPGGGFGLFDACTSEWGATTAIWGARYGGPSTDTCAAFPPQLKTGCDFRWGWFKGTSNPTVNYQRVTCPAEIIAKSGCAVSNYSAPRIRQAPAFDKSITTFAATAKTPNPFATATLQVSASTAEAPIAPTTQISFTHTSATSRVLQRRRRYSPSEQKKVTECDDTCEA